MKTTDLFKGNRSSQKMNESIQKTFGKKLNLESFNLEELQDARNRLRTHVSQMRSTAGFNENLENDTFHQAQWILDTINSEIAEREEFIVDDEIVENTEGKNMSKLNEGEVQQASAIVTANTMVDRVSRWIDELSSMENDTLLQLGDSIRDEMGQEQSKQFISAVAPSINSALEMLKQTREELSSGVRTLTGEENPVDMLGDEPGMGDEFGGDEFGGDDEIAPAEPDAMVDPGMGDDEFGAADAAAGGVEAAGRMKRESIERGAKLMKILAG